MSAGVDCFVSGADVGTVVAGCQTWQSENTKCTASRQSNAARSEDHNHRNSMYSPNINS